MDLYAGRCVLIWWMLAILTVTLFEPPVVTACNGTVCRLPNCLCPSTNIPGGIPPADTPQMILVSFDGRLEKNTEKVIAQLFNEDRTNPNECPIVSTLYVSDDRTDYCSVNRLWAQGHEIAVNGLLQHNQGFWQSAKREDYRREASAQKENIVEKGGVTQFNVAGWRTPFLQPGGDAQFYALKADLDFYFDSTLRAGFPNKTNYWPFTLDTPFGEEITCELWPCPQKKHPGLWEVPVGKLYDKASGLPCAYLDSCRTLLSSPGKTYELLNDNFQRIYKTNRAPFSINVHARWLLDNREAMSGFEKFLDYVSNQEGIWVVTVQQALEWIRNPVKLSSLSTFKAFGCVERRFKTGCLTVNERNSTIKLFDGLIQDGSNLLLWQYGALAIVLIIIVRVDRHNR